MSGGHRSSVVGKMAGIGKIMDRVQLLSAVV